MTDTDDDLFEPASGPPPTSYENPGPVFDATYGSTCEFLDDIAPGDQIRAVGGDSYAHASCLRAYLKPVVWE